MSCMFFLGKVMDRVGRLFLFTLVLLSMVETAKADGSVVADRLSRLCMQLHYEAVDCKFEYEDGKHEAEVTISVDEHPKEANSWFNEYFGQYKMPVGTIHIRFLNAQGAVASNMYVPLSSTWAWGEFITFSLYADGNPCFTVECVESRSEDYEGVSETDLVNLANVERKLPFQVVDESLLEQIQAILDTKGYPVVVKVKSSELVASNIANSGATTMKARVIIRAIKPRNIEE